MCLDFQVWFSCSLVLLLGELPCVTSPLQALSSAWVGGRPHILCQMAGTRLQLAFIMAVILVPGENRVSSFRSLFSFRVSFSFFCPIYKKQCVLTWITGELKKAGRGTQFTGRNHCTHVVYVLPGLDPSGCDHCVPTSQVITAC